MASRRRLDRELVARGLAADLEQAREAIRSRRVVIDGAPGLAETTLVADSSHISISRARRFVSRGGDKLRGALDDLCLDVTGMRCLDAGAGSGGFTDCLLQAGAAHVTAVDVGYGQFDWSLRTSSRVDLMERTNVRALAGHAHRFDLIVADLSFVTLRSMARTLAALAGGCAICVLLVKPQFEAAAGQVDPGGVVRDPGAWLQVLESVIEVLAGQGLGTVEVAPSRVKGAGGNQEFFLMAVPGHEVEARAAGRALEMLG
ncbi:MAG: TlyA family RNA methyltransferase [Actinomycetota bacterium]